MMMMMMMMMMVMMMMIIIISLYRRPPSLEGSFQASPVKSLSKLEKLKRKEK